jgi:hypothetical protein
MDDQQPQKEYTAEFRESAVKLAVESNQPITKTLKNWVSIKIYAAYLNQ